MLTQINTQRHALRSEIRTTVVTKTQIMLKIRFRTVSHEMTSSVSQPAYSLASAKAMDEKFMEATMDLIRFMAGTCSEGPENRRWVNVNVESCGETKTK